MLKKNQTELLAPAKDAECGIAAINCGADAVYAGAARFSARRNAGMDTPELEKLIHYAHTYGARVYIALNTILRDAELEDARRLIIRLNERGADGFIIQDFGIVEMDLPPVHLIASTQTHNTTAEKVSFLEHAGFSRVILARELSLDTIRAIRDATSVELEAFVHGALCVSYSGRCWMSQFIGGRSANRGECAQPCRRRYTLLDNNGHRAAPDAHYLCLRDMNRGDHLGALLDAGISSFKIEGRLKDISYVRNITAYYRQRLDEALESRALGRSSYGTTECRFTPDPALSFNRGFTDYFLNGTAGEIESFETPKAQGKPVGSVTASNGAMLQVSDGIFSPGDGIAVMTSRGLTGAFVNGFSAGRIRLSTPIKAAPGDPVYLNHSAPFEKELSGEPCARTIAVAITVTSTPEADALRVTAHAETHDGIVVDARAEEHFAHAGKPESASAALKASFAKAGGTAFHVTGVSITGPLPFMPSAAANALRRTVLRALEDDLRARTQIPAKQISPTTHPYVSRAADYRENIANHLARRFYERHGVTVTEMAAESGADLSGREVMITKHCIARALGKCGERNELFLLDEDGRRFKLAFDCARCEMNVIAPGRDIREG